MKRLKAWFSRVPRPVRACADLLLAALLLAVCYAASGCPSFGIRDAFRRAEKAELTGPSRILDVVDVPRDWAVSGYSRLVVADAGEEILFFPQATPRGSTSMDGKLFRREKEDGLLAVPAPCDGIFSPDRGGDTVLPLFLFADDERAVTVRAELTLSSAYGVTGTARRERGYFTLYLPAPAGIWDTGDGALLTALAETNRLYAGQSQSFPVRVLLYDGSGTLLDEREALIRSRVSQAEEKVPSCILP